MSHVGSLANTLLSHFDGEVIHPGDARYDDSRSIFNAMIDRRPSLILRCANATDVAKGIELALNAGSPLSVKGGGHGVAGHAVADNALMLDLSAMKEAAVDTSQQTVSTGPGLTLGDLDRATQQHDLAVPTGVISMTGLAGLALGGGLGWLNGKYGLACDNLLSAEMVTGKAEIVTASPSENADLYWALRGGGGNFGVVTSFNFQAHEVGEVLAGAVTFGPDTAVDALVFYDEFASRCPDEVTTAASVWREPDGDVHVSVAVCCTRDLADPDSVLRPLRNFGPPEDEAVSVMPYTDFQAGSDAGFPPGRLHYWKSSSLKKIGADLARILVDHVARMPSSATGVGFQQMHGAATRVAPTETAFHDREPHYDFQILSQWSDPADTDENIDWTRALFDAVRPYASDSVYVNNLGDEGEDRVRQAYGENYERLRSIKRKYDPTNFFRLNQNIPPGP